MSREGFNDPNTTHEIFSSRVKVPATEYVGKQGRIFYHEDTGELRLSDGITPHGLPIFVGGSGVDLKLYVERGLPLTTPIALASRSIALGDGSQANAYGTIVQASGKFTNSGDAQVGSYVGRNITTNNSLTEIFLDGVTAKLIVPPNTSIAFTVTIIARRTDSSSNEGAVYELRGGIDRSTFPSSTRLIGIPSQTVVSEDNPLWNAVVSADSVNATLRIQVSGESGKTIRWVAHIQTVEVKT